MESLYRSIYSEVEFSSRNAEGSSIAFRATIAAVDFMASGTFRGETAQKVNSDQRQ